MRRLAIAALLFLSFVLFISCNKLACNKPICVAIVKHIGDNKLEICFTIENRTGRNIYFSPYSFPFCVTKEYGGEKSDAMIEFYHSAPEFNNSNVLSDLRAFPKNDVKRSGRSGDENLGPFYENPCFHNEVVRNLLNLQTSAFKNYFIKDKSHFPYYGKGFGCTDSIDNSLCYWLDMNLDCIFIPKDSKIIVNTWTFDLRKIDFDKLYIQYKIPNDNRIRFSLNSYVNNYEGFRRIMNQIDSLKICFPKTLMGYELYTDSIKSDVIEIKNQSKYNYQ